MGNCGECFPIEAQVRDKNPAELLNTGKVPEARVEPAKEGICGKHLGLHPEVRVTWRQTSPMESTAQLEVTCW